MLLSCALSSAQLAIDNPEIGPAKMMIASTATAFCSEIGCSIPRCARYCDTLGWSVGAGIQTSDVMPPSIDTTQHSTVLRPVKVSAKYCGQFILIGEGAYLRRPLMKNCLITHLWLCLNRKLPQNFVDTFSKHKQPAAAAAVSRQINSSQLITAEASQLFREREKWWLSLIVIILWLLLRHTSSTPVTPGLVSLCLLAQRPATLYID